MKASELDELFDNDDDNISKHLDLTKAKRPLVELRRVNIDFPVWMVESLDLESKRLGVSRQSVIKHWIGERLDKNAKSDS